MEKNCRRKEVRQYRDCPEKANQLCEGFGNYTVRNKSSQDIILSLLRNWELYMPF